MTAQKLLLFAAAAVLAITIARAHPVNILGVDLNDVVNRTVCPIVVDEDVDMDRIPQRIKVIRCARQYKDWCKAHDIPNHECCKTRSRIGQLECVELRDTVLVYNKKLKTTKTHDVPVGCSCMVMRSVPAKLIPEHINAFSNEHSARR